MNVSVCFVCMLRVRVVCMFVVCVCSVCGVRVMAGVYFVCGVRLCVYSVSAVYL